MQNSAFPDLNLFLSQALRLLLPQPVLESMMDAQAAFTGKESRQGEDAEVQEVPQEAQRCKKCRKAWYTHGIRSWMHSRFRNYMFKIAGSVELLKFFVYVSHSSRNFRIFYETFTTMSNTIDTDARLKQALENVRRASSSCWLTCMPSIITVSAGRVRMKDLKHRISS